MRCLASAALILVALAGLSGSGRAAGAWQTFLRPYRYIDIAPRGDTLWCATSEAGLVRFDRRTGQFSSLTRVPGELASNRLTALAFDRSGRLWVGTDGQGVSRLSADRSRWDLVNNLDGLPTGVIRTLVAQGDTVWIGTTGGIALWNGREVAGALPDGVNASPFANNDITGIAVRGDQLWVSTQAGPYVSQISSGLSIWAPADSGLATLAVDALADDAGSLFGLSAGTVYRFDEANSRWVPYGGLGYINRISDQGGVLLAGGQSGIFRWNGISWDVANAGLTSAVCLPTDAPCLDVFALAVDDSNHVMAANFTGLWRQPEGAGAWAQMVPATIVGNDVQNLVLEGPRTYVATFDEGVSRYDGSNWRNWIPGPCGTGCDTTFQSSAFTFMMFIDRQGRKWVGSWSSDIEVFDDPPGATPHFEHYRPSDTLAVDKHTFAWSAMADSAGGRWLGMDTNGLGDDPAPIGIEYYSSGDPPVYTANYQTRNTPSMDNDYVRAITLDRLGHMWVGYKEKGLDVFSVPAPGQPLVQLDDFPANTTTLDVFAVVSQGDSVWVMSTADLRLYHPGSNSLSRTFILPGAPAQRALHPLDIGPDGSVWVGTVAGVRIYHPDGSTEDLTIDNSPLTNNEVRAIRVDPVTGVAWIGTGEGLNRFDPNYVAPPPAPLPSLSARVYPNPATLTGVGLSLRIVGNASSYRGEIYDISGRVVRRFASSSVAPFWDGRDGDGSFVQPGLYLARIEAGGRTTTARIVLLR